MSAPIAFLEDDEDLRMITQKLIKRKFNLDCLCLAGYDEFILRDIEVLDTKIVFLDINLGDGRPSGIDAYEWLKGHDYRGKIFFLTGHARYHPLVVQTAKIGIRVLEKPIDATELNAIIKEAGVT